MSVTFSLFMTGVIVIFILLKLYKKSLTTFYFLSSIYISNLLYRYIDQGIAIYSFMFLIFILVIRVSRRE